MTYENSTVYVRLSDNAKKDIDCETGMLNAASMLSDHNAKRCAYCTQTYLVNCTGSMLPAKKEQRRKRITSPSPNTLKSMAATAAKSQALKSKNCHFVIKSPDPTEGFR